MGKKNGRFTTELNCHKITAIGVEIPSNGDAIYSEATKISYSRRDLTVWNGDVIIRSCIRFVCKNLLFQKMEKMFAVVMKSLSAQETMRKTEEIALSKRQSTKHDMDVFLQMRDWSCCAVVILQCTCALRVRADDTLKIRLKLHVCWKVHTHHRIIRNSFVEGGDFFLIYEECLKWTEQ